MIIFVCFVNFFKVDIDDILIICDDLDTPVGTYRLRYQGGTGGHNGLKDIEKNLTTSSTLLNPVINNTINGGVEIGGKNKDKEKYINGSD